MDSPAGISMSYFSCRQAGQIKFFSNFILCAFCFALSSCAAATVREANYKFLFFNSFTAKSAARAVIAM